MTTTIAALLVLLLLPLVLLLYISETKQQRARRMRSNGWTYRRIAQRLNVSATTARRYAAA